jgi:WhiB family redox-sensing transcriptional regulator
VFKTEQANCLGVDPELFFPVGQINATTEKTLNRICMKCEILNDCLNYALNVKVDGYWAGTTEAQRKDLRRFFHITPIRIDQQLERTHRDSIKEAG